MQTGVEKDLTIIQCMNDLQPELKRILDLELQAGNFVIDATRGWPDTGSVFITLGQPFHNRYAANSVVKYTEQSDSHYWKADYSCGKPLHIVAY